MSMINLFDLATDHLIVVTMTDHPLAHGSGPSLISTLRPSVSPSATTRSRSLAMESEIIDTQPDLPRVLRGRRREIEIYKTHWDIMTEEELRKACKIPDSNLTSNSSATLSRTSSSSPLPSSNATPRSRPSLIDRTSTFRASGMERRNRRRSTDVLVVSPDSKPQIDTAESNIFPPSPPGSLWDDRNSVLTKSADDLRSDTFYPLRLLSRIVKELGEDSIKLERENKELLRLQDKVQQDIHAMEAEPLQLEDEESPSTEAWIMRDDQVRFQSLTS